MPPGNIALDVYLLRNQEVLLTKIFSDNDELRNMLFDGFSALLQASFSQILQPTKQDYNQVLVLENKLFKFVPLSTDLTYLVNSTLELSQVHEMVNQIISKEQEILDQLTAFQNMLIDTSVFQKEKTPLTPTDLTKDISKRDISGFFSPYSLTEVGNTAAKNYKRMNKNFHQIGVTERRLAHDQNTLTQKFNQITKAEKTLLRKSLFIELRSFTQSHF